MKKTNTCKQITQNSPRYPDFQKVVPDAPRIQFLTSSIPNQTTPTSRAAIPQKRRGEGEIKPLRSTPKCRTMTSTDHPLKPTMKNPRHVTATLIRSWTLNQDTHFSRRNPHLPPAHLGHKVQVAYDSQFRKDQSSTFTILPYAHHEERAVIWAISPDLQRYLSAIWMIMSQPRRPLHNLVVPSQPQTADRRLPKTKHESHTPTHAE